MTTFSFLLTLPMRIRAIGLILAIGVATGAGVALVASTSLDPFLEALSLAAWALVLGVIGLAVIPRIVGQDPKLSTLKRLFAAAFLVRLTLAVVFMAAVPSIAPDNTYL